MSQIYKNLKIEMLSVIFDNSHKWNIRKKTMKEKNKRTNPNETGFDLDFKLRFTYLNLFSIK